MCRKIIDWDLEYDSIVWQPCVHPSIPGEFMMACCPDCKLPMLFKETDGREYVYIILDGDYYKLWTTSKSPKPTLRNYTQ